ncbi:hypothetical protein [Aliarcobacter butzleri]|uniref:hypothetical protein n=1 Tax=Aliarcobacter butzleri TaxID=28197 RepID=UPI00125EF405|nr:hypothetical protein [Aliarcobacter butzleri]
MKYLFFAIFITIILGFSGCYNEDDKRELVKIRETLNEIKIQMDKADIKLPSQETLNYFAKVYKLNTEEQPNIDLIGHYEKDGKLYIILETAKDKICEMPMLETKKGWSAFGVSCK